MDNRMFDAVGQLNAYDNRDALHQLVKYASIIAASPLPVNTDVVTRQSLPSLTEAQQNELIRKALYSMEGKLSLGQAMANPIRRNLDYQGVGRKFVVVDPLPPGAIPVYDRDIDVAAVVVSSNGSAPESRIFGDRVTIPEFEVVCNPTVRIIEVKRRRFNVIDRAQQKARQEIQAQEDNNIFAALDFAAANFDNTPNAMGASLRKSNLLAIKREIDKWDLVTVRYAMNITQFTDILEWESASGNAVSDLDPVTQREILQTGLYARIWGADIIVSKIVPDGTVYGSADKEFVGVMPIRQDIEVLPADEPKQLKLGWVVNEIIGIGIVNPRGVAMSTQ